MTISPDARTPSADIHTLTGSTPPGAARLVQPRSFKPEATSAAGPFHLHGVAPDAEVIDLAGRVRALAERERALWSRSSAVEDAIDEATPLHPAHFLDPSSTSFKDALAQHDRHVKQVGAQLGLPRWEKLASRASCRLARWGAHLARLAPRTQTGLKAKAEASTVCMKGETLSLSDWRKDLSLSISADALRIIGAEADAQAEQDRQADDELFHYGRRWEAANQEHRAAEVAMEASWHRYLAIAPADPEEMFVSDQDHPHVRPYARPRGDGRRMWYGDPESLQMLREGYPKELSEERRLGILAAHDRWSKAHADARREAGCDDCEAAETAASKRESDARRFLLATPAHTLGGLRLKANAALAQYGGTEYGIEGVRRKLKAAVQHGNALDEAAMAVLLDLVTLSAEHPAPAPVPLDFIEFPSGRYAVGTPREVVETYRTFLELELSYLNHEVYGQHQGAMHYWHDNPAARLHRPGGPEASSRAAAVLGLLGLMPVAGRDGRAQPMARVA